jgi:hypothetical protein
MIIGEGAHRYEVIDRWGKLPKGKRFGTTHGVIEDGEGRIFIHHTGPESIFIFDPDGRFLGSWGSEITTGAHGMFYNREADGEYLYLAATQQNFVAKFTLDGREVLRIRMPPREEIYLFHRMFQPTEAAVASTGDIYIADGYGQPWIHRFTAAGEYMQSWGGGGGQPGQLDNPHGIKIDTRSGRELIVVADRKNNRLQYFTLEGQLARVSRPDIRWPCTVEIRGDQVYIPDLFSRVTILDKDDKAIAQLGDRPDLWKRVDWPNLPPSDWEVGKFSSPHDLHVDAGGNIYVVEWLDHGTGKCTKLVRVAP